MSTHAARFCAALASGIILALSPGPILAQGGTSNTPTGVLPCGPILLLPTEEGLPRKFDTIREYARAGLWPQAVQLLQGILDTPEDVFFSLGEGRSPGSARGEAERLLGTFPEPGREMYEQMIGPRARERLVAVRHDPEGLAGITQRFLHTRAGAEAAWRLGALHLDRGRPGVAAAHFERALRSQGGTERPDGVLLLRAAVAFQASGREERLDTLQRRFPDVTAALETVDPMLTLPEAARLFSRERASMAPGDWPVHRGDDARSARSEALAYQGETAWRQTLGRERVIHGWFAEATRRCELQARDPFRSIETRPLPLSASFPIAVAGRILVRDHAGVSAHAVTTGERLWSAPLTWSLDSAVRDPGGLAHISSWIDSYLIHYPHLISDNSICGTLSSDGRHAYAIEDLPLPPFPRNYASFHARQLFGVDFPGAPEWSTALHHNQLVALDLSSGRVMWELGGRGAWRDTFFLGPPLPLEGKLFVPAQKGFELFLACLDPVDGRLLWRQGLASFKTALPKDGGRRLRALHLTHTDGLIICPTHAGGLLAFDQAAGHLAWALPYREIPPLPPPSTDIFGRGRGRPGQFRPTLVHEPPHLRSEWRVTPPIASGRRVVVAPSDSSDLLCIDPQEGTLAWKMGRGENGPEADLYLAGVDEGKILLTGQKCVEALDLRDGKRLWRLETPPPTGEGVLVAGVYHLPIRAARAERDEILTIDIAQGRFIGRTGTERAVLGNLVMHRGRLISQNSLELVGFQIEARGGEP